MAVKLCLLDIQDYFLRLVMRFSDSCGAIINDKCKLYGFEKMYLNVHLCAIVMVETL